MGNIKEKYKIIKVNTWEQARKLCQSLSPNWIFRGQSDSEWHLVPSIERRMSDTWFSDLSLKIHEQAIIKELKNRAKYFIDFTPEEKDYIDWLALVQHHGGLTRLLDFTKSFYIAAYFALSGAKSNSAIWAINYEMLINRIKGKTKKDDLDDPEKMLAYVNQIIYANEDFNGVYPVIPSFVFDRLINQQGLFLFPGNAQNSFSENLLASFNIDPESYIDPKVEDYNPNASYYIYENDNSCIIKIDLSINVLKAAFYDFSLMNINYSTLFPDFDGYVKSLNDRLVTYLKENHD